MTASPHSRRDSRLSLSFVAALCLGLLATTFALCRLRPIYWEDVWWHLGVGEFIMTHHSIPTTDIFSWTVRGAAWMNTEWLYEVILYGCVRVMGLAGVIFLKTALMGAALYFMDRRLRLWKASTLERLLFLGLAFLGAWPFWVERADLSSLALVSALFFAVDRAAAASRWRRKDSVLWIIAFALWPNIHGAFPAGLAVIGLRGLFMLPDRPALGRRLLLCALLCGAATLLTPSGIRLPFELQRNLNAHINNMQEWLPPQGLGFSLFFLSLGLTLVSFAFRGKRTWDDAFAACIVALFAGYTLRHARFVHFFMIGAFPYAAKQWLKNRWRNHLAERLIPWEKAALSVSALLLFTTSALSARRVQGGVSAADSGYVKEACDFIETHKITGPFYNDYKFGSYWIWRFKGSPPVFQDGRHATVTGYDRLIEATLEAQRSPKTWNAYADKLGIAAALVKYPPQTGGIRPAVFDRYFPRASWGLVYWDDQSLIFVRRTPPHAALLKEWEYRAIKADWNLDSYRDQLRRGLLDRRAARRELERNLAFNPGCWRARVDLYWLGRESALQ